MKENDPIGDTAIFHETTMMMGGRVGFSPSIWGFPTLVVPQNGRFVMENHIKIDDLGGKPTILGNTHITGLLGPYLSRRVVPCRAVSCCAFPRWTMAALCCLSLMRLVVQQQRGGGRMDGWTDSKAGRLSVGPKSPVILLMDEILHHQG